MSRLKRPLGPALLLLALALLIAAQPAAAAESGTVRLGEAPELPAAAQVLGAAPDDQTLHLTIALEPSDPAALERFATEVSTPGSLFFRHYLSVPQFAERFGAEPARIDAVRSALGARGLRVGQPGANRLALPVTATVAEAEAAFATPIESVRLPDGRIAHANVRAPALPVAVAGDVEAVLGLEDAATSYRHDSGQATSEAGLSATSGSEAGASATRAQTPPAPCEKAVKTEEANGGSLTSDDIAAAYGIDRIYERGNFGAGQAVAMLELEPFLASDVEVFQQCYGTAAEITTSNVNGGPGPYTGAKEQAEEADLDIEQVIGLAPAARIIVYQGPNKGDTSIEILERWVEQNQAKVMSSSWGSCESKVAPGAKDVFGTLLQEAAAQGQSFFVAAGDQGSEDCYEPPENEGEPDPPGDDTKLAVDSPGSDPFATDVGGTLLLEYEKPPRQEYIWSEGKFGGGGGGGISENFAMPGYQSSAAAALNVVNPLSSGTVCAATAGYCRQVPDVSANGAGGSSLVVFERGHWTTIAGTSAAAPLWAAFATLVNAEPACGGSPIGFANPSLYAVAGTDYAANFNDVVAGRPGGPQTNDTVFGGKKPYPATVGYDMASGLGTPIGDHLATALCGLVGHRYTVTVENPGDRASFTRRAVSLQLRASDSGGASLTFAATGLPAGLEIDPGNGVVFGVPTTPGSSRVTVTARDQYGNQAETAFTWSVAVGPQPRRVLGARIAGLAEGKPRLTISLAPNDGETLTAVVIQLPPRIRAGADRDVRHGLHLRDDRGRRLGSALSTPGRKVRLDLKRGALQANLRLSGRALVASDALARRARRGKVGALPAKVTISDTAGRSRLSLPLRP